MSRGHFSPIQPLGAVDLTSRSRRISSPSPFQPHSVNFARIRRKQLVGSPDSITINPCNVSPRQFVGRPEGIVLRMMRSDLDAAFSSSPSPRLVPRYSSWTSNLRRRIPSTERRTQFEIDAAGPTRHQPSSSPLTYRRFAPLASRRSAIDNSPGSSMRKYRQKRMCDARWAYGVREGCTFDLVLSL